MDEDTSASETAGIDLVRSFLRGQNLEQIGRVEDAVSLYEAAVAAGFDSPGPYDRLIHIYSNQAQHKQVVRVTTAALSAVRTHADKLRWYEVMRTEANSALQRVPKAAPKQR